MNSNSKKLGIYLGIAAAITAASVTLRTVACLYDLNYLLGRFEDNLLIDIANSLLWSGAILMLTYCFAAEKIKLRPSFTGPATYIATGAVGAALLFFSRRLFEFAAQKSESVINTEVARSSGILVPVTILTAIFAILSVWHFAANSFFSEAKTEKRAYPAIFTLLMMCCYAAVLYFSTDLPINAPNKLCDQMAFLISALFFLYETRISLGREKWRAYSAFGLMALMFTAYSSIPSLITYFLRGAVISASIEENVLTLTLMIFIGARLTLTVFLPEDKENGTVSVLREAADGRKGEVQLTETRFAEKYAVQMSLDAIIDQDIALEMEDRAVTDDEPVSEAENPMVTPTPETIFDEDTLIDPGTDGQMSMGYELLTPGEEENTALPDTEDAGKE